MMFSMLPSTAHWDPTATQEYVPYTQQWTGACPHCPAGYYAQDSYPTFGGMAPQVSLTHSDETDSRLRFSLLFFSTRLVFKVVTATCMTPIRVMGGVSFKVVGYLHETCLPDSPDHGAKLVATTPSLDPMPRLPLSGSVDCGF